LNRDRGRGGSVVARIGTDECRLAVPDPCALVTSPAGVSDRSRLGRGAFRQIARGTVCSPDSRRVDSHVMADVTQILNAIESGDPHAAAELLPLVYDELRKLAEARLAEEKPGQTLQATALVHEAYLRLVGREQPRGWDGRGHFFAAAAEAMRRILVDHVRHKKSLKGGGGRARVELREDAAASERSDEILAVDEALAGLAATDPQAAELVKLRYFAGLSIDEAARALNISPRSADRLWAYARAWLRRAVGGS
jgi:RNA polymerase sigma factor (TIGR02999 family)